MPDQRNPHTAFGKRTTSQATYTLPGTISRPQRLATDRDGEHLMLAEEFEAEMAPRRVEG
ncbi:hypothetical protein SAMN05216532_8487 [Streptomyces sp. 2231.1]|uniref:hypothetical protein n=1 Tax=Streptomyces sp. 2231.1 TaxID=1855347 RepID=UPI00089831A1|nr:hypothetical protein [Streptomyces sp. 2231.1]SEE71673.1 hypothetical protein SAMN05216532_8487 [Streptomyces sp. 2231.1]